MNFTNSDGLSTIYGCQRSGERHRLLHSQEAFIQFVDADGRPWKLDLLGISSGGVCFGLENGQTILERGSKIDGIVLQIASVRVEGALTIAHATEEFASGTICGGQFHPATEDDARKLAEVIAKLGW
jgi:hypothetical protein